ncbi:MAG: hypothetical protein NTV39_00095 [Candidatus Saccharibacteria bacterium]|nr:hypothetical protein [Candidatus Saccharibacteria bacterium]
MKTFKTNILSWVMSLVVITAIGGSILAVSAPQTTSAAGSSDSCSSGFLGFPSWYRGLTNSDCNIESPNGTKGLSHFVWRIALNVVEMAVVAAAYLSGFMFLFGGWMFIISRGNPDGAVKARSIMTMAALGLVLTVSAVALVNFIFDKVLS